MAKKTTTSPPHPKASITKTIVAQLQGSTEREFEAMFYFLLEFASLGLAVVTAERFLTERPRTVWRREMTVRDVTFLVTGKLRPTPHLEVTIVKKPVQKAPATAPAAKKAA